MEKDRTDKERALEAAIGHLEKEFGKGAVMKLGESQANMNVETDIQSVRCGEIPGIHTIGFEGLNDRITMTHEAFSREGFAAGAVEAALMTEGITGVPEFRELLLH